VASFFIYNRCDFLRNTVQKPQKRAKTASRKPQKRAKTTSQKPQKRAKWAPMNATKSDAT
jgi:hypothetical protein